MYELKSVVVR